MTPSEFTEVCHTLGLTNGDVALITGNTTRAVQYWISGKALEDFNGVEGTIEIVVGRL